MAFFIAAPDFALAGANDNESMSAFLLTMHGQAAALAGVGLSANPYQPDTYEGSHWASGWLAGILELDQQPYAVQKAGRGRSVARLRAVGSEPRVG